MLTNCTGIDNDSTSWYIVIVLTTIVITRVLFERNKTCSTSEWLGIRLKSNLKTKSKNRLAISKYMMNDNY